MDAKTQKAELTRAAIVGAALDLAAAEGLESITLQAVLLWLVYISKQLA